MWAILDGLFLEAVDRDHGRPGMDMWSIFVMGVLRLNLNGDDDRLHHWVNNPRTIRQILGPGLVDDQKRHDVPTRKEKVSLRTPDRLDPIPPVVVQAGPELIKKNARRTGTVTR